MVDETLNEAVAAMLDYLNSNVPWRVFFQAAHGASGPKVVGIDFVDPVSYPDTQQPIQRIAFKYGKTRVPIEQQARNAQMMCPHFTKHVPTVYAHGRYNGSAWMATEFISETTFHDVVYRGLLPERSIALAYRHICDTFLKVWKGSAVTHFAPGLCPRLPHQWHQRIETALREVLLPGDSRCRTLGDVFNKPLRINGDNFPSLSSIFRQLEYCPPAIGVTCHGDPNADNLLVRIIDEQDVSWFLTDWEWCGLHDWRLSAAHLVGWWTAGASRVVRQPVAEVASDCIDIVYQIVKPAVCENLRKIALELCLEMAYFSRDASWYAHFRRLLTLFHLGNIRFAAARGQNEYSLVLLGEGIRSFYHM